MARKCPYCGGKATQANTSSTALVFGGRRFDSFTCEACGASVRIPRTIPLIAFSLTMLALVGAVVIAVVQGLIPGLVWAVVIGFAASILELFVRVEKVAAPPSQISAPGAAQQATNYRRCAVCDQLYPTEYDGCPFCARTNHRPAAER
jgi:hypothetical protein